MAEDILFQGKGYSLKYIVDALNKVDRAVNTLAKESGQAAVDAQAGVDGALTRLGQVYNELSGLISAMPDSLRTSFRSDWLADIENGQGEVVGTKELYSSLSTLTQTATQIRADFEQADSDYKNLVSSYIQFDATGITLGEKDSPFKLIVTNSRIEIWNYDYSRSEPITYWDTAVLHAPKSVEIPTGGNQTMGQFRWVPRTGANGQPGNLSLVKV